ncbi:MAG: hypothetical protein PW790_10985 [Parvibaculaceae bacterium]|nr:hypothetical protein [Parvibaculaceae bacterium]
MSHLRNILFLVMIFITTDISLAQSKSIHTVSLFADDIADELNARYQNVTDTCPGGTPAHYCAGIVIRGTTYSTAYNSWDPSPSALQLGSVSFSYLRSDLRISGLAHASGFIFTDTNTARKQGRFLEYRCMYPVNGSTLSIPVSYGCGSGLYTGDINSCDTLNIMTAEQWYAGKTGEGGCSFSTKVAQKFATSLDATRKYHVILKETWNELLVAVWAPGIPDKLPIEAFFYTTPAGLTEARSYQKDFCSSKAARLVPIVAITFASNPSIFSYKASDQNQASCPAH